MSQVSPTNDKKRRRSSVSELARAKSADLRAIKRELAKDAPEWAKKFLPYFEMAIPVIAATMAAADIAAPHVIKYGTIAYTFVKEREELAYGILGFILCFFGGVYPALILTVETFYQCGWDRTCNAVMDIYEETVKVKKKFEEADMQAAIQEGNEKDAKEDDGEVPRAKFSKKMALFFEVCDPRKVQDAVGILWGNWLCVLAALNIYFAKVISLGQGIGEVIQRVLNQYIVPVLKVALPEKYHRWIPVLTGYVSKAIGVSVAWFFQAVLSATHSGIRGGIMMSRAGFQYLAKQDGKEYHQEDSIIDEVVGYSAAAIGIFLQIQSGFGLPFPVNIIMFPFTFAEWWIRWTLAGNDMF